MTSLVTASVYGANLGDMLWTTPLARYEPDLVVQLRGTDAKSRATAPILDGVARVEFVDDPVETPKTPIRAHVTQQILTAYGHGGKPSIPRVILTADEIKWVIDWAAANGIYRSKTIAMVTHTSGWRDPSNYRAYYTRGPSDMYAKLTGFWRGAGYKVIQFGPPADFYSADIVEPLEGVTLIRNLTIRQLAAAYHLIGKLISPDTGDYHLMLAVGGKVAQLSPAHSDQLGYRHWDLHYDKTCWGDELPRVRYIEHKDWWQAMDTRLFKDIGTTEEIPS